MNKKKIPQIKKDIKDFLLQEEGNMVKKDVAKMGMGLLAIGIGLGAAVKADPTLAQCDCCNPCPTHCSY